MSKQKQILDYLTAHPNATSLEISTAVGCSHDYVRVAVARGGRKMARGVKGQRGLAPLNTDGSAPYKILVCLSHTEEAWLRQQIGETGQPASKIIRELIRATAISDAVGKWQ